MAPLENQYCTLFDSEYLARALVLYRSLEEVCPHFHLRAYCMDPGLADAVTKLELANLTAIDIAEVEAGDPELAAVRCRRTAAEYCWTATPSVCLHSLTAEPALQGITYLDADLVFFCDPQPLFAELGSASTLLVPHRFSPRWAHCTRTHGRYNVAFNVFRRDAEGLRALGWWRERCLEWCHARIEDGRFGDQKYLDDFPSLFGGVHVAEHRGAGVAPWNSEDVELALRDGQIWVDGARLIFYHFTWLQLHRAAPGVARLSRAIGSVAPILTPYRTVPDRPPIMWRPWPGFRFRPREVELLWEPYVERLREAHAEMDGLGETRVAALAAPPSLPWFLADSLRALLPSRARRLASRARGWARRSRAGGART